MINLFRKSSFSFTAASIVAIVILVAQFDTIKRRDESNALSISWDVYGYYLYLPAVFIYHDPGLQNQSWIDLAQAQYKTQPMGFYQAVQGIKGRKNIIYTPGLAFFYLPSFTLAHLYSKISGDLSDGFSMPYQWSLIFTGLLIAIANIFLLRRFLLVFFSDKITSAVIIIIGLGTNYLFQTGLTPTMPHNFLFFINLVILLCCCDFQKKINYKIVFITGLVIGWGILCRPTNLIMICIPAYILAAFAFGESKILWKNLFKQYLVLGSGVAIVVSIMIVYSFYTTDKPFVNNHVEIFDFKHPYTLNFLFSFKNGWLIYTPVMLFSFIGLISFFKFSRLLFYPVTIVFLIHIYIISSWDCWWYGSQLGQRGMVDIYPLAALIMGSLLSHLKLANFIFRIPVFAVITSCVFLNMFQTWQFSRWILSPLRMNADYYKAVFLKTEINEYAYRFIQDPDRFTYANIDFIDDENHYSKKILLSIDFETIQPDINKDQLVDTTGFNSKHCYLLNGKDTYSPKYKEEYYNITNNSFAWIKITTDMLTGKIETGNKIYLVATFQSKGRFYQYFAKEVTNQCKPNQWSNVELNYLTPILRHADDKIVCYCVNTGDAAIYIDNFKVIVLERK